MFLSLTTLLGGIVLGGGLSGNLNNLFDSITNLLVGVGVAAAVVGIVVGGLMRIFAFGNERRVMVSNVALSCAVIGLIIVFLGNSAAGFIDSVLPAGTR